MPATRQRGGSAFRVVTSRDRWKKLPSSALEALTVWVVMAMTVVALWSFFVTLSNLRAPRVELAGPLPTAIIFVSLLVAASVWREAPKEGYARRVVAEA
ncbi:hypothetical protein M885DRAFT_556806 [Pelagophyceae sp. CCMP2097]|nr:hypothetical protein M885DRAFT_556806 [Pelagophyceae sp. CCMP2097]